MKKRSLLFILLLTAVFSGLLVSGCRKQQDVTGGDCSYKDYKGTVTIVSVDADPKTPGIMGVNYTFTAEDANAPEPVKRIPGTIGVPKEVVDQKGVIADKKFQTKASYIDKGSCAPGPNLDNFYTWQ